MIKGIFRNNENGLNHLGSLDPRDKKKLLPFLSPTWLAEPRDNKKVENGGSYKEKKSSWEVIFFLGSSGSSFVTPSHLQ